MKNKEHGTFYAVLLILAVVFVFLLSFAFHLVLMPYLLMITLSAIGTKLGFFQCLAIWVVTITLIQLIKPKRVNKE